MRLTLAAVHLLALGIGLGASWARSRALRGRLDTEGLRRVFYSDNWWGVSGLLLLGTGLARLLMETEKTTSYYMNNYLFHTKMGLFILVVLLEIWPAMTLIKWRRARARSGNVATSASGRIAIISTLQVLLLVAILVIAVAMARGYGMS